MRIHPDLHTLREILATNRGAAFGRVARHAEGDGGTDAEGFGDNGLEVGEGTGLGVGYGVGEEVLGFGCVEFVAEFGVAGGGFEEVVDYCAEGDGGCVAACEARGNRQIGNGI